MKRGRASVYRDGGAVHREAPSTRFCSSGVGDRVGMSSVDRMNETRGILTVRSTFSAIALGLATASLTLPAPALADRHGHERKYKRTSNGIQYWRGDDGKYYCKRSNGTTGLIIGAAAGALAGRAIDTRGERATGTIVGAAAGALLGRQIERGQVRCR
jgi:hypothetical protein